MTTQQTSLIAVLASLIAFLGAIYGFDSESIEQGVAAVTGIVTGIFAIYEIIKKKKG